jgi:hypothetical protein
MLSCGCRMAARDEASTRHHIPEGRDLPIWGQVGRIKWLFVQEFNLHKYRLPSRYRPSAFCSAMSNSR